jgi:4-hydroxybenzoyl-CoA reductase subunit beta
MLLPQHNYVIPRTLDECLAALRAAGPRGQVVAGGTDVIYNMRLKMFRPETVISVRRLDELRQIEELPDGSLRIGAACRLTDLAEHGVINARFPALADSIRAVASTHIRNIATLGGNICLQTRCWFTNNSAQWRAGKESCFKNDGDLCHVIKSSAQKCHAISNSDTPPVLIVLGATLTIRSDGARRELPIAEFFNADGIDYMNLTPGELVTHVTIPPCDDRTVFLKHAARRGIDFSIGAVAARCDGAGEHVDNLSIVLGSLSTHPVKLTQAAEIVRAGGLTREAIERAADVARDDLGEVTNLYSRAVYKKQIARVLVRRALTALAET